MIPGIVAGQMLAAAGGGGGSDPNFADVLLLMHCEGSNGSTTFIDSSSYGRTLTAVSNAQISTASPIEGSGSMTVSSAPGRVTAPDSSDWAFPGDFTMEAFVAHTSPSGFEVLFAQRNSGGSQFVLYLDSTEYRIFCTGGLLNLTSSTVSVGTTVHHVAFVRDGTDFYFYLDGVAIAAGSSASAWPDFAAAFSIGGDGSSGVLHGKMDEVRITNMCRYPGGTTFTPPSGAFPDS